MRQEIMRGAINWDRHERQSNRYGSIFVTSMTWDGLPLGCEAYRDDKIANAHYGLRVRITVEVVEARDSGHIGDLALGITPSRPGVGELVDLGVGIFEPTTGIDGDPGILLRPGDGRRELWIDPRKLYRLHEQTVCVFVEATADDFSPAPDIPRPDKSMYDSGDNTYQTKYITDEEMVRSGAPTKITPLGDGMFMVEADHPGVGKRVK